MEKQTYEKCKEIERKSMSMLIPKLRHKYDIMHPLDDKVSQEYIGDYICIKDQRATIIEFKAEMKHTGNLFLEIWSNIGLNEGWYRKCRADFVIYHFLLAGKVYYVDIQGLKQVLDESKLRTAKQEKTDQKNDALGMLLPIKDYPKYVKLISI